MFVFVYCQFDYIIFFGNEVGLHVILLICAHIFAQAPSFQAPTQIYISMSSFSYHFQAFCIQMPRRDQLRLGRLLVADHLTVGRMLQESHRRSGHVGRRWGLT